MKKQIKVYIETELRNYHQSKQELEDIVNNIVDGGSKEDNMGIRGSGTSNVVESKAFKLISNKRIRRLEETIKAIDTIVSQLDPAKKTLVEMKYWTKPNPWSNDGMCRELNVSKRTFHRWSDQIILAIAAELGLIDSEKLAI